MDNQDEVKPDTEQAVEGDEKPEPTLEDYRALEQKNKELFARAKKAEETAKKARLEPTPNKQADNDPNINERLDRIELQTKGYSDSEVEFLMRNGGKKAVDDEYVKAAIEAKRQQSKAEAATVDSDSAKSDIEKKFTGDQIKGMTAAEMEKILPKA